MKEAHLKALIQSLGENGCGNTLRVITLYNWKSTFFTKTHLEALPLSKLLVFTIIQGFLKSCETCS